MIEDARRGAGLSQDALAEALKRRGVDCSGSTISRWESEERQPYAVKQVLALLDVLEIPPAPFVRALGFNIPMPQAASLEAELVEALLALPKRRRLILLQWLQAEQGGIPPTGAAAG